MNEAAVTDGRLVRGARTRRTIARHAVDVASLEGLNGLSLGRLAGDLGLSKSGIQTLFRTKENLQLAAVESAREQFADAVVGPALAAVPGVTRLRALIERWIVYAETPLFTGGCFWAANLPEFDSRPGPVRDALFRQHGEWLSVLAGRAAARRRRRRDRGAGRRPGRLPDRRGADVRQHRPARR
ncbi:TetR/AcrR family transcriptional regulator [Actinomadura madurae]|nr:TetR/AcrR family transcriptional regulator [Actinomadura madurae]MCP9976875.1 TetR/AcrR family transcriptional regulator [Actinomadura madurae]